jgi:hypothetical protein
MTARMIIAKLVAFLFVQDSVRSTTKFTYCTCTFTRYQIKNLYAFFGIILKMDFREHVRPSANVTNRGRPDIKMGHRPPGTSLLWKNGSKRQKTVCVNYIDPS